MAIVSDSLAVGVVFAISLTVIQRAVGFVRGILFCRYMPDHELGQWSMVYSFLMLLAPLAVLGLPGSFGRFVEYYMQRGQAGVFIRRIAKISCVLTLLLAGSMYLLPVTFSQIMFRSPEHTDIIGCMAFAIVMVSTCNFLFSLMESLRQIRLVTIMRFVQGVSFAVFGTVFILTWSNGASAATFGFAIACSLASIPALCFLWKYQNAFAQTGETLTQSAMWKRIAPFAIWLWASNFVHNMFEVADRYMLVHWSSVPSEVAHGFVGQYHSGRVVPLLLVGIAVVICGLFLPFMTVLWEKGQKREATRQINMTIKLMAIGFTTAAIAIIILSPLLFDVILDGRYDDGLAVLPLTLVYCIWFSLFWMWQTYLWVAEKGKLVFAVTAVGLVTNLALNALLIPHMELWGAVIATATATFACVILVGFANLYAGGSIDNRIWGLLALPLIALLPVWLACVILLAVVAISWKTNFIFDPDDREIAKGYFAQMKAKLSGGNK